jgi:hypothetical protein
MHPFAGALFVGTEFPAELIRINADDSWDLIAGRARRTSWGRKLPLSGMGDGLGYPENISFDRMQHHEGWMYVGTADYSKMWRDKPVLGRLVQPYMGCDLFATRDGVHYDAVTHSGFGDSTNGRVRTLASTPVGLFVGTGNARRGGRVYLGARAADGRVLAP